MWKFHDLWYNISYTYMHTCTYTCTIYIHQYCLNVNKHKTQSNLFIWLILLQCPRGTTIVTALVTACHWVFWFVNWVQLIFIYIQMAFDIVPHPLATMSKIASSCRLLLTDFPNGEFPVTGYNDGSVAKVSILDTKMVSMNSPFCWKFRTSCS